MDCKTIEISTIIRKLNKEIKKQNTKLFEKVAKEIEKQKEKKQKR